MSLGSGWRLPIRIARREAMRSKGRSILVLVMIALPVTVVAAADVLIHTNDVNTVESLDRTLGTKAAAMIGFVPDDCNADVQQGIDPLGSGWGTGGDQSCAHIEDASQALALLEDRPTTPARETYVPVKTDKGQVDAFGRELDLTNPLTAGLYELKDGRWPTAPDEVAINSYLASRGPALGERLTMPDKANGDLVRKVVGIAESTSVRGGAVIVGAAGSLGPTETATPTGELSKWLVGGPALSWDEVTALNKVGMLASSREVILHPSPAALAAQRATTGGSSTDDSVIAVAVLIVVMVLIEVVLLAGPAFAVGARRQSRALALLMATGGTPKQARRVVLGSGVVLGVVAGVAGVGLGIVGARLIEPIAQSRSYSWLGPFEIPWLQLVGIGLFGFVSAVIAAVVPAWIASRQDVVAVLAGRRGDRRPSAKSPLLGVVLVAGGVVCAVIGGPEPSSQGAVWIALSAILCVLGMLFLVPLVVVGVAKLGRHLPLAVRFAVRDAARHRTRTTPAVAAVAATVAGVVCLSIGTTSDEKENRETYTPSLPVGTASIGASGVDADWDAYDKAIQDEVPGAQLDRVDGVPYDGADGAWNQVSFQLPGGEPVVSDGWSTAGSTDTLVSGADLAPYLRARLGAQAGDVAKQLAAGGAVVFSGGPPDSGQVEVTFEQTDSNGDVQSGGSATVPALFLDLGATRAPGQAIISPQVADAVKAPHGTVGMLVSGKTISSKAESNLNEVLQGLSTPASIYVERGYQADDSVAIVQLVLAGLGAILMLGGTLTATFLALSDARPDLATLSAVGAAPRTRRAVAAAYAITVGLVGAVLGALVGLVPGIAIAYSATNQSWRGCSSPSGVSDMSCIPGAPSYYLNIPWLLIGGLVVLLPLAVAAVVWLSARSRLPLVARLA